ncbi:MAG: metal-dependent transcriptional regulator [Chloroflexi bacterium]|nr:metal-dependent transcriptional regulator [Chloroflexota bacterium]
MTNKRILSSAIEDYLKTIYELELGAGAVTTMALAGAMGVSAASATNMVKKLAAMKLARHAPYHGVELTPAGEKIALEVVRHHRLIELFLHEALGIPWDQVHAEAHKLEHVLSDNLEDHIANFLGDPTTDPHGDPIPTKAGIIAQTAQLSLADLTTDTRATIQRVAAQDPARLRYLGELGLVPNANLSVIEQTPFDGPVRARLANGDERVIDRALARQIWVAKETETRSRKPKSKIIKHS